jgi:hypothetical protein
MSTTYPARIDTTTSLPTVVDNFTSITATSINQLRDAILSIETALGVNPGGTYGSAAARLAALENTVGNLQIISLAQDLGGTLAQPLVIGLQGRPLSTTSPQAGQVLTWNGIAWIPTDIVSGGGGLITFSQDLSGSASAQTVVGIQTIPVSSTAPVTGNVLTYNGTQWIPQAVSSGSVTLMGDVTGLATANTVVNIHGASVPIAGSLTTGNVLQVSGSSALTYAAVNLAGGANYVTGVLPTGNLPNLAGDVQGPPATNTVAKIRGTLVSTNSVANDGYALVSTGGTYVPTGVAPVYNVKNFGAKGDNTTDDTVAIQAAIDNTPQGATLYFPEGIYLQTSPLIIRNHAIMMTGPPGGVSGGSFSGGAVINAVNHTNAQFPSFNSWTGPQLIIGGQGQVYTITQVGNFYCLNMNSNNSGNNNCISLSESDVGIINGLGTGVGPGINTGFTFECWVNPDGYNPTPGNKSIIATSGGQRGANTPFASAFELSVLNNYSLFVRLTTTSGSVSFSTAASALPSNALTHVAVTYDQSHIRLFVGGVLIHTAAQTGTIVQQPWEDFTIGYQESFWPLQESNSNVFGTMLFASIRLSSSCWYTSNFTPPTTEFSFLPFSAANEVVILLINFDPQYIAFGGAYVIGFCGSASGGGGGRSGHGDPVYMFLGHGLNLPLLNPCTIQNLNFVGNSFGEAIYCYGGNAMTFKDLAINTTDKGITILGGYDHLIERCYIGASLTHQSNCWCIGLIDKPGGSLNRINTCTLNGGYISVVLTFGATLIDCFTNTCPTLTGLYSVTGLGNLADLIVTNCIWDDEAFPTIDSGFYVNGMENFLSRNNIPPGTDISTCPLYKLGNCGYIELNDQYTIVNPGASGIIHFTNPMANNVPITVYNPFNEQGHVVPLVDPDGYGPVIIPMQEQFGSLVVNVSSGDGYDTGSIILNGDQQLWGMVQVTDTNTLLTGSVNVVFPYLIAGYKRTVINSTAQILTFIGTHGTGVPVPSGATAVIFCNGTNWIQIL